MIEIENCSIQGEHYTLSVIDGIVHGIFKPETPVIHTALAKKMVADRLVLTAGNTYPLYVELTNAVSIDRPSRNYLASQEAVRGLSATAILVENQITKLGGNIYIRIDKPRIPTKLFTDKGKAIVWLRHFRAMN